MVVSLNIFKSHICLTRCHQNFNILLAILLKNWYVQNLRKNLMIPYRPTDMINKLTGIFRPFSNIQFLKSIKLELICLKQLACCKSFVWLFRGGSQPQSKGDDSGCPASPYTEKAVLRWGRGHASAIPPPPKKWM